VIKYLGSKRRLVPVLAAMVESLGATSALDLFTGTTRVAQAIKALGASVTAVDTARYAEVFARCYIESDATAIDYRELAQAVEHLRGVPPSPGYVTETFCVKSRYFQPFNGERIDGVREEIERAFAGTTLYPILLTSLIEAADRVDSTTGLQMAYVKEWSARSFNPLELRVPELLEGVGRAVRADASEVASTLGHFDVAYVDPPYNQHRYYTNYHVWETLVAWDAPDHYGVACKRADARDDNTKSVFNSKRTMPAALTQVVREIDCELLILSYNDESWLTLDDLVAMCAERGCVRAVSFDQARYVGARIGIHSPSGQKVGTVSHLRNREHVVVAGPVASVTRALSALAPDGVDVGLQVP
jgi:adenine-specific DNA-methyltransferase